MAAQPAAVAMSSKCMVPPWWMRSEDFMKEGKIFIKKKSPLPHIPTLFQKLIMAMAYFAQWKWKRYGKSPLAGKSIDEFYAKVKGEVSIYIGENRKPSTLKKLNSKHIFKAKVTILLPYSARYLLHASA